MNTNFQAAYKFFNEAKYTKAIQQLKKNKKPDFDSLKLEMLCESRLKKWVKVIALGNILISKTNSQVHLREIYYIMATAHAMQEDIHNIQKCLEKSAEVDSSIKNAKALFELLGVYSKLHKFSKLEALGPKLLSWEKYHLPVTLMMVECAAQKGDKELLSNRLKKASFYFEQFNKEQFGKLVNLMLGAGLYDLAEVAIRRYEQIHGAASISQKVQLMMGRGDYRQAKNLIESYDLKVINSPHAYYAKGKLENLNGEYQHAFESFSAGANIEKSILNKSKTKDYTIEYNRLIPKMTKYFSKDKVSYGSKNVFIYGFPRSGTTLLDNILDTQKDALVLSERDIIPSLFTEFNKLNPRYSYPISIPKLTTADLAHLRSKYVSNVIEQGFEIPKSEIVIEKGPHFTEMLPFIRMLFPDSKLITTIRHPLDVCLSCFQTHFQANTYNSHLITLDDVVNRYINVFSLYERYQNELGIQPHVVRYEDLVLNIEEEMNKVFEYIGMEPNDAYLEFNKHASRKFVNSASRGQTNQALYTSSMYKWRNYEEHLTPYFKKLSYFIEKFGYEC